MWFGMYSRCLSDSLYVSKSEMSKTELRRTSKGNVVYVSYFYFSSFSERLSIRHMLPEICIGSCSDPTKRRSIHLDSQSTEGT